MQYVSGDINSSVFLDIGINSGLMNIKGNFIIIVRTIVFAGISVGGTDSIKEKQENASVVIIIPKIIITKFVVDHNPNIDRHKINGIVENIHPKTKELKTFPNRIVLTDIGHAINLSIVLCLVSHGKTTGPMDVAVRNNTMVNNPDVK